MNEDYEAEEGGKEAIIYCQAMIRDKKDIKQEHTPRESMLNQIEEHHPKHNPNKII